LPTREQFAALGALGRPVVFVTAIQLPYLRSIAGPLTPLRLPAAPDRARDRTEELRDRVARLLEAGAVDAELAVLDPLFDRFDPAEVAAALLALSQRPGGAPSEPPASEPPVSGWVKVFVNVGKRDRAQPKDLVGALIREVGLAKNDIGRIEQREAFSIVDIAAHAADRAVRGLSGVTIKGRRAQAKLEGGRHLDDAERVPHVDAPDVGFGEAQLPDQRPDEVLGARPILLPDVHEHLHPACHGGIGRGPFALPPSRFPK